jgi:hypothetical protein
MCDGATSAACALSSLADGAPGGTAPAAAACLVAQLGTAQHVCQQNRFDIAA